MYSSIVQLDDPLHNPPANKLADLKESSTAHCTSLLGGWSTRQSAHSCLFSGLSDYPEFNTHVSGEPQTASLLDVQLG